MQRPLHHAFVIGILILAAVAKAQSNGPLRVHPENPRYFTDDAGRPILLAGSHTWNNIIDMGPSDPPPVFDVDKHFEWLKSYGHNFTRGWAWELTSWDSTANGRWGKDRPHAVAPLPWVRTGPGLALDGKPRFDLTQHSPQFLVRLQTRVAKAQAQGIFISVMLFEGWGLQFSPDAWKHHPFNASNNMNGIDGDVNGDGMGLEVQTLVHPQVTKLQEAYVRQVVGALNQYDNVLYEISNETHPPSTDWQYHMIRFIKQCEAALPKQHPVGMTFQYKGGSNETLFNSPADWVSPNPEGGFRDNPPDMKGGKVVLSDTDHLWGIGGNAGWVWMTVTRGLNPLFMDPYDGVVLGNEFDPQFEMLRKNLGYALRYAGQMDLAAATPRNGLSSTRFCLAEPGNSYLVYAPESGTFEVDLSAADGTYAVEWLNPATGGRTTEKAVEGGAKRSFRAPFGEAAVLFLKKR